MKIQIDFQLEYLSLLLPLLLIGGLAFFVLLWDTVLKPRDKSALLGFSLAGVGLALVLSLSHWAAIGEASHSIFSGRLVVDRYSQFFNVIFLLVAGLVLLISREYLDREKIHIGEYYALVLFSVFGMMLLGMAGDLLTLFLGVEVMSIPVYALVAFNRSHYRSIEGALKYFVLGAFASGFLLYGIALLYGATHTTSLEGIRTFLASGSRGAPLLKVSMALLMVGFAFKIAAAPFHMWTPDAYEGAPTPITAAMATGVKAGAFAAVIRTLLSLGPALEWLEPVVWGLAALTIIVGNLGALRQTNLKRMLAYSSIAHTGYMLTAILPMMSRDPVLVGDAVSGLMFYLLTYVFMNVGAFAIIVMAGREGDEVLEVHDWEGFGFKRPWLGAAMMLFMVSMGGLPPTAGFFAKFNLLSTVVDAGYVSLVVIAVLMSAASFYYYLRLVVAMYMRPSTPREFPSFSILGTVSVMACALAVVWIGIMPSQPVAFLAWARASIVSLL